MRELMRQHGIVEAPVDRVAAVVFDVRAQPGVTVEVDEAARTIAVQGQWWYRGETSLAAAGDGRTAVTSRIVDVAEKGRWAVRFVARQPLRDAPAAFDARLAEIAARLGCRAYRVEGPAAAR